jgi:integrase
VGKLLSMPAHTRLYRRGAVYYHLAAFPKDIIDSYGKVEETFSLKTKDLNEALRLVRIKAVEVDRKFDDHRKSTLQTSGPLQYSLTAEQIKLAGDEYFASILEEDEENRLWGFDEYEVTPDGKHWISVFPDTPRSTFEETAELREAMTEVTRLDYARGRPGGFFRDEAEEVLNWDTINIRLHPKSPSWPLLVRELQETYLRAAEARAERDWGKIVPTPVSSQPEASPVQQPSEFPMLSTAIESFVSERAMSNWTPKTQRDYNTWLQAFSDVVGNRPIDSYSKKDGRSFKDTLSKLPANWRKKPRLKNLGITQAARKSVELGMPPMSLENANKAINRVSAFWDWADSNYFDEPGPKPLSGLSFKIQSAQRDKRNPFSTQQLTRIFTAPIYTGFQSDRKWHTPGPVQDATSSRFWLPLLGLFTGARLAEILFHTVDDLIEQDGIQMLRIEAGEDGKRVKSRASIRRIPVHKALIDLGFLRLVQSRSNSGATLLFADCDQKHPAKAAARRMQSKSGFPRSQIPGETARRCFRGAVVGHDTLQLSALPRKPEQPGTR